jgi:hypothetical protein
MTAKAFVKKINSVQGFNITLPPDAERVILKNDSIIKTRVPENWTVNEFKRYCSKFVKIYTYDEVKKREAEQSLLRNIEKSKQTGRGKSNKSDRKNLTLSSAEI